MYSERNSTIELHFQAAQELDVNLMYDIYKMGSSSLLLERTKSVLSQYGLLNHRNPPGNLSRAGYRAAEAREDNDVN